MTCLSGLISLVLMAGPEAQDVDPAARANAEREVAEQVRVMNYGNSWETSQSLARKCAEDESRGVRHLADAILANITIDINNGTTEPQPAKDRDERLRMLVNALRLVRPYPDREDVIATFARVLKKRCGEIDSRVGEDPVIRSVADALAQSRSPELDGLRRSTIGPLREVVKKSRKASLWDLCRSAVDALRQIDREGSPEMLEVYAELLGAERAEVHISVADAIAEIAKGANREDPNWMRIIRRLERVLDDEDFRARQSATRALGRIGPAAEGSIAKLGDLLDEQKEPEFGVRRMAAVALKRIGLNSEAVAELLKAMGDRDPDVKENLADALEKVRPRPIIDVDLGVQGGLAAYKRKWRRTMTGEEDKPVKLAAVRILSWNLPLMDKPERIETIARRLLAYLDDADAEIREEAATALGKLDNKGLGIRLLLNEIKKEKPPETRMLATVTIEKLAAGVTPEESQILIEELGGSLKDLKGPLLAETGLAVWRLGGTIVSQQGIGEGQLKRLDASLDSAIAILNAQPREASLSGAALLDPASQVKPISEVAYNLKTIKDAIETRLNKSEGNLKLLLKLGKEAFGENPIVCSMVLLAPVLWVASVLSFGFLYLARPRLIVNFSEWAHSIVREKDESNATVRSACKILMLPVFPVRWWDRSGRALDSWVRMRLERAKVGFSSQGVFEPGGRYEVRSGGSDEAISGPHLDGKIAEAFPDGKSGLLILGDDPIGRRWIVHRVVRWAIDPPSSPDAPGPEAAGSSSAAVPRNRPMLPVIVSEDDLVGEGGQRLDEDKLREIVCRKLANLIGTRRTISDELHDTLINDRVLMIICNLQGAGHSKLIGMIQSVYRDWVISATEAVGQDSYLFADKVTILKVNPTPA